MAIGIAYYGVGTGQTAYSLIHDPATNQVWNVTAGAWEAVNAANRASYVYGEAATNALGDYHAVFPAAITASGFYMAQIFLRRGASPAITDLCLATQDLPFDSFSVRTPLSARVEVRGQVVDTAPTADTFKGSANFSMVNDIYCRTGGFKRVVFNTGELVSIDRKIVA